MRWLGWLMVLTAVPGALAGQTTKCVVVQSNGAAEFVARQVDYLLRMRKPEEALARVKTELERRPKDAAVEELLGEVLYHQGDLKGAAAAINSALAMDVCVGRAHYFVWRFDGLAGRNDAGWEELELAHRLAPADGAISRTFEQVAKARELEAGGLVVAKLATLREGFFAKAVDCDGIAVLGSAEVDSDALALACGKVRMMLAGAPAIRKTLARNGAELHIIGERQGTSDMPENRRFKQQTYVDAEGKSTDMDARTRGVGGLKSSCGEENLLGLPLDRYAGGMDTCVHEFAHDVMEYGVTGKQEREIEAQYKAALAQGLWKGAYAAVNAKEYWAEISMWYFGGHGALVSRGFPAAGRAGLEGYDAGGFGLAERIYGGK